MWWLLIIGTNVGGLAAALSARNGKSPRRTLTRLAYLFFALLAVSAGLAGFNAMHVWRVPIPDSVDPAVAEQIRAEGFSRSLDCLIAGSLAFLLPAIVALVLAARTRPPQDDETYHP
jgi:hypothetical protein